MRTVTRWWLALFVVVLSSATNAAVASDNVATLIVVVGAPGEDAYAKVFAEDVSAWTKAAEASPVQLQVIGNDELSGKTDRERLQAAIAAGLANDAADTPVWLVFLGHGTFDGRRAAFNLRGPDVTNVELAEWLRDARRPLVVIDTTAASAPFLTALSAPNRVVITATKSGQQRNYARFGRYLVKRIVDPAADLDKDDQTSLFEAFLAAGRDTADFYKNDGRIATEHPLLDDDGDGRGVRVDFFERDRLVKAPADGTSADGDLARRICLRPSAAEQRLRPSQVAERDDLEAQLAALRRKKAELPEAEYFAELERILVELAKLYARPQR
jgi:hypothetical protein